MVARQISLALKKLVRLCLQTRISCLIKLSNFLYVHRSNPQQSVRSLQPKNVTVIIKPITYLIVDLHCTSCLIERINTVTIITPPSGRGLVIPIFFPWFFFLFFFGGHLPQTSGFRSAKQILVVSFATQARAFILSDRNIFYTPGGGENNGKV